jgi:hypothetical protein
MSPYVANSSRNYLRDYGILVLQVEAYLRGDSRHKDGISIPQHLMEKSKTIPKSEGQETYLRFPLVERLLSTIAARSDSDRIGHPFGRPTLGDVEHLVCPQFPLVLNPNIPLSQTHPPDLPYVRAKFLSFERKHSTDTGSELPVPYYGCLRRYEAYLFQTTFPAYNALLYHEVSATVQIVTLHADFGKPPLPTRNNEINWAELLEPYSFKEIFQDETPMEVLHRASPSSTVNNVWFRNARHILHCARQINNLIRLFETFFQTLGFQGLRDIAESIDLNKEISFVYSPILDFEQARYFTALYDFFLREHALNIARPILHLLHIPFSHSHHLNLVHKVIVDAIEPPIHSFILHDDDDDTDMDISSSSSST